MTLVSWHHLAAPIRFDPLCNGCESFDNDLPRAPFMVCRSPAKADYLTHDNRDCRVSTPGLLAPEPISPRATPPL